MKQVIVKIPKTQTKKGIFDLIFETQLQMYLSKHGFEKYLFNIKEEMFQMKDKRLINYVVVEERDYCNQLSNQINLSDFIGQVKKNKDM
jgi:hypothetical protein